MGLFVVFWFGVMFLSPHKMFLMSLQVANNITAHK